MPVLFIFPSSISFTHKQNDALPPAYLIDTNLSSFTKSAPDLPAWLTMYDITPGDFKIKLNTGVDSLPAGTYNEAVTILAVDGEDESEATLNINLVLTATQLLEVSPSSASFSFTVGGSNPSGKLFSILSENSWTVAKTQSWLGLSITAGSNNGSFTVTVNPTGLSPGTYNDTVTVDDGGTPVNIPVSLTVSDPDTGSDYLNIYPTHLNYGFTEGGALPLSQNIDLNASANYTVATAQAWIDLSASSGGAGSSSITITLQNLAVLAVGNHVGYVDFTLGTIVKRVTVYLTIYELVTETLIPGELYFCDDENYIKVSSARNDTHLLMQISASYLSKNYNLPYNIPFFDGVASKRIGAEAKNILGDSNIFGLAEIFVFTPYLPISLAIDINETETATNTVLQTISLSNIKFIKGLKPLTNWMGNVPKKLFLTKNATSIFSVLSNGSASGNLEITGDVTQSITNAAQVFDYYTVVLPFSQLALEVGFEFNVSLLSESIDVIIIPENIDHSMLYAESQWGTFEPFELTGEVKEFKDYKDQAFTFRKNHLQTETKVFERNKRTMYKINTGYIVSEEMIDYLEVLLEAENYYLQTSTGFRKVRNTTKKLEARATLRESSQADLTFEDTTT